MSLIKLGTSTKTRIRTPPAIEPSSRRWVVEDEPRLRPFYTVKSHHELWTGATWITLALTYGDLATHKLSEDAAAIVNGQYRDRDKEGSKDAKRN